MSFKYSLTLPAQGGNKLARFRNWADANIPQIDYSLPVQVPIKTEALTLRLRSLDDAECIRQVFPATLP